MLSLLNCFIFSISMRLLFFLGILLALALGFTLLQFEILLLHLRVGSLIIYQWGLRDNRVPSSRFNLTLIGAIQERLATFAHLRLCNRVIQTQSLRIHSGGVNHMD